MVIKKRYAIIYNSLVINAIRWDGITPWSECFYRLENIQVIDCPEYVFPGWKYIDNQWVEPDPPDNLDPPPEG